MYYSERRAAEERTEADIEFSHFVVVSSEGAIIGFRRDNGSIYKLLMGTDTSWIKINSTDQWLELPEEESARIRQKAQESFGRIPVYRVPRFIV